jgi:hypothetical protein
MPDGEIAVALEARLETRAESEPRRAFVEGTDVTGASIYGEFGDEPGNSGTHRDPNTVDGIHGSVRGD